MERIRLFNAIKKIVDKNYKEEDTSAQKAYDSFIKISVIVRKYEQKLVSDFKKALKREIEKNQS